MNYIKEINAFYDRQEQEPLSGSAIALWYALMNINNKTRWKNSFTSPSSVLRIKAGLTESSFKRARAELVELGYIEVESQGRGKAPVYKMCSLVVGDEEGSRSGEAVLLGSGEMVVPEEVEQAPVHGVSNGEKEESVFEAESLDEELQSIPFEQAENPSKVQLVGEQLTHLMTQHADHLPNHVPAPIIKQYIMNTKQNNTDASVGDKEKRGAKQQDAIVFYQENFGLVGPFVAESLTDWIRTLGEELVIEAMKRALERNKTSWGYVKSILNAWDKKGIHTVGQARAEQVAFDNERREGNRRRGSFFVEKKDIVPEWYEGESRKRREKEIEKQKKEENVTVEQVEEAMRRYWEGSGV